ncbi:MAG: hypothetical protein IH586_06320 [Anaerolineaceae bacterium]|nr:hypothetical protein [Anaerolineaceae bacterium]
MSIFMVDQNKLIVTLHRDDCSILPGDQLKALKNGEIVKKDNQSWFCEKDLDMQKINHMMNGRYWILLLCDNCFN